ncbi:CGNR zinc finger domain-containing protein [Amycolatopsis rhabdoformis]|uniref:CGNR zinc finger domain-containing protein n=1 Tax=Amycolatopsis rhabdoformis TaxID=1448059 RepID=A0ABZ1I3F5_9PSEU|nr:CGNR zinc finger domain-containing protein [Amycolatopsis rhabdoformis]WSE28704.1 CGNR zinc finger domain-containing protein [Amycolatopsis rhabdoformis]
MPSSTTAEAPVPATAAAIVDLLNSRAYTVHEDKLDDAGLARALLSPFGQDETPIPPKRLKLVRDLRAALMTVLTGDDPTEAWATFTGRTSGVTFTQDFSTPGKVTPRQSTGDTVVGGITLHVATLVEDGTWSRLRLCANEECSAVFYDTTRSRTRRWHSYEICGNRTNVANHRARKATQR